MVFINECPFQLQPLYKVDCGFPHSASTDSFVHGTDMGASLSGALTGTGMSAFYTVSNKSEEAYC